MSNLPVELPAIKLYPNPTQHSFTLENAQGEIIIYNTLGQPVQSVMVEQSPFTINISDLPSGYYYLQSINQGKTIPFMKE